MDRRKPARDVDLAENRFGTILRLEKSLGRNEIGADLRKYRRKYGLPKR